MSDIKEQSVSKLKCHPYLWFKMPSTEKKARVLLLGKMNAQVLQNIKSLLEHSVLNLT